MARPIGYEMPALQWCYRCVPEGVMDDDPLTDEHAAYGAYYCEECGEEMTPEKYETDEEAGL